MVFITPKYRNTEILDFIDENAASVAAIPQKDYNNFHKNHAHTRNIVHHPSFIIPAYAN